MATAIFQARHDEEAELVLGIGVEIARLPIAVEHEQTFAADIAAHHLEIFDGIGVGGEIARLDPAFQMLGGLEIVGRIDGGAVLLEDPVVDRLGRAVGTHQVLQREGEACRALVPLHDGQNTGFLGLGHGGVKFGQRLRRLGHADLGGQFLVIEHAGHRVVEAHAVERAGTTRPAALFNAQLHQLAGGELVPAQRGEIVVEIAQQVVGDEIGDRGHADQVRRIVFRQNARGVLHHIGELVFLDVEGDIGELLGELFGQARGQREAGFEIGIEHDRVGAAGGRGHCGAGRCGHRQGQGCDTKCVAGLISQDDLLQGKGSGYFHLLNGFSAWSRRRVNTSLRPVCGDYTSLRNASMTAVARRSSGPIIQLVTKPKPIRRRGSAKPTCPPAPSCPKQPSPR